MKKASFVLLFQLEVFQLGLKQIVFNIDYFIIFLINNWVFTLWLLKVVIHTNTPTPKETQFANIYIVEDGTN